MNVTVGRTVYYFPSQDDRASGIIQRDHEPVPGVVSAVWDKNQITLAGFDADGMAFSARKVEFRDGEVSDGEKETGGFACWMPYQLTPGVSSQGRKEPQENPTSVVDLAQTTDEAKTT